jgi:hypothetical protein
MLLLDILCHNPEDKMRQGPRPLLVQTWAAQAALSRPGRKKPEKPSSRDLDLFVRDFAQVRQPRRRG